MEKVGKALPTGESQQLCTQPPTDVRSPLWMNRRLSFTAWWLAKRRRNFAMP